MKKKIVFLDGDGTLWYPKSTKRTKKPHWVYHNLETKDNYLEYIELTPQTKETLESLHEKGILLVVISASPYSEEVAAKELKERIDYFGLNDLFYTYRSSPGDDPRGKVSVMSEILHELKLTKEDALMVGDSYLYDYSAPKEAGIDALFIENKVAKMPDFVGADIQNIKEVNDLLKILE